MAENVEKVNALVQKDRWITETAEKLDISHGSVYSIIHEDLRYHKICARWVPEKLTDEQSTNDVWKSASNFVSDIVKKLSCNGLPQVMKHCCTT
jgi:hypothetical protein